MEDELLRWLGPACALLGFARVNYLLFPSLYSGWLYTGDLLRTAGYACLLVGAAREISRLLGRPGPTWRSSRTGAGSRASSTTGWCRS